MYNTPEMEKVLYIIFLFQGELGEGGSKGRKGGKGPLVGLVLISYCGILLYGIILCGAVYYYVVY